MRGGGGAATKETQFLQIDFISPHLTLASNSQPQFPQLQYGDNKTQWRGCCQYMWSTLNALFKCCIFIINYYYYYWQTIFRTSTYLQLPNTGGKPQGNSPVLFVRLLWEWQKTMDGIQTFSYMHRHTYVLARWKGTNLSGFTSISATPPPWSCMPHYSAVVSDPLEQWPPTRGLLGIHGLQFPSTRQHPFKLFY